MKSPWNCSVEITLLKQRCRCEVGCGLNLLVGEDSLEETLSAEAQKHIFMHVCWAFDLIQVMQSIYSSVHLCSSYCFQRTVLLEQIILISQLKLIFLQNSSVLVFFEGCSSTKNLCNFLTVLLTWWYSCLDISTVSAQQ